MPRYSFLNTVTKEEYDLELKMSEREIYLRDNPNVQQVLKTMNLVDPVGIGVTKPPEDFQRHVIKRIADNVPGATAVGVKRWGATREW